MAPNFEYRFMVRPLGDEEGGGYLIELPDLPGCIADGDTPEETIREGGDALRSWIETHRELGREISLPATYSGSWRVRVPKSLHQRLSERAKAEGVSLNTLVVSLLAEGLGPHERWNR